MSGSRAGTEAYEFLSRVPVFSRLGARSLRKLVRLCIERTYDAGSSIITEGSTGLGLFVITSGSVEVFKRDGSDRVVLARLDRGAVLGELALIDAQPRSASAVALTDTTCLLIARSGFHDLVRREPDIAWCFVPVLAARMRDLQAQVMAARDHAPGLDAGHRPARSEGLGTEAVEASSDDRQTEPAADDTASRPTGERLVQAQHALARAGLTALSGGVRVLGAMLDTFVEESGIDESPADMAGRLPRSLSRAASAGLREAERLPERMVATLRHHLRQD